MRDKRVSKRRWGKIVRRRALSIVLLLAASAAAAFVFLYWQGSRTVDRSGDYVALGSSFAAGIGLGVKAPGSPVHCLRTEGGYPARLARQTGLRLVDMSCSGSTNTHILEGGQWLLGPQLAAIGPKVRLVTITSGGNDVGYIGDLMAASGAMGRIGTWMHGSIAPAAARPYGSVAKQLELAVRRIRAAAPGAKIILVTYPAILPASGNCAATGVSNEQAEVSRNVARLLAQATREAARNSDAQLVDMDEASIGHDVCSTAPWTNGARVNGGAPFHPNEAGAKATAARIMAVLRS